MCDCQPDTPAFPKGVWGCPHGNVWKVQRCNDIFDPAGGGIDWWVRVGDRAALRYREKAAKLGVNTDEPDWIHAMNRHRAPQKLSIFTIIMGTIFFLWLLGMAVNFFTDPKPVRDTNSLTTQSAPAAPSTPREAPERVQERPVGQIWAEAKADKLQALWGVTSWEEMCDTADYTCGVIGVTSDVENQLIIDVNREASYPATVEAADRFTSEAVRALNRVDPEVEEILVRDINGAQITRMHVNDFLRDTGA